MGTWGPGNFDGDAQCDIRDQFVHDTATRINRELLADDMDGARADREVMPWIAILLAICDRCGGHPPRANVIARWQSRFLQLFERDPNAWDRAESAAERRNVIVTTFSRVTELSHDLYGRHNDDEMPAAGATCLLPLDNGRFGACRVLHRAFDDDDELYGQPVVLVATSE